MPGNQVGERLKAAPASAPHTMRALAWAAGFYEGEGTCMFATGSHRACVNQVEREPLERMKATFGGHIYAIPPHRASKASWRWIVFGARARGVLMTLYPLLCLKRQAQIRKVVATGAVRTQRRS